MAIFQKSRLGMYWLIAACVGLIGMQQTALSQTAPAPPFAIPAPPAWPPAQLATQIIDVGYAGFHQMIDVNGDGNPDFCRFVGDTPDGIYLSCQLGTTPTYLSKNPYGLSSPKGLPMGSPPWGILSGTSTSGPRYCANFETPVKAMKGRLAPLSTYVLKCVYGTPPIKGRTQRFLATFTSNVCSTGEKGNLLSEKDARQDPYLLCTNPLTGSWHASRQDPDGITWEMTGGAEYNKTDGSTVTWALLNQLTYRIQPNDKAVPFTKAQGGNPTRVKMYFTLNKDGSTKQEVMANGTASSPTTNYSSSNSSVTTTMKPQGNGFAISIIKSNCVGKVTSCSTVGTFNGTSSDGLTIQWGGNNSPSASDVRPTTSALADKFNQVQIVQQDMVKQAIAKADATLAAKSPDKWTSDDITKIVKILTVQTSAPGTPPASAGVTQQQLVWWGGMASWHVTALLVAGLVIAPEAELAAGLFELGNIGISAALELGNIASDNDAQARSVEDFCTKHPEIQNCRDLILQGDAK